MTKLKIISTTATFFVVFLLSLTNTFAQTQPKPQAETSYDVVLHILTASNNSGDKSTVPATLSNVVKKLKTVYSFANYRLDSTFLQRIANNGNIEFRGIDNTSIQNQENSPQTFLDWTINGFQSLPNTNGQNLIQVQNFRFGQRVPIRTSDGGINYEQIGLTIQRFSMSENVPTIIGSLSTSNPNELTLIVLTVKPAQE